MGCCIVKGVSERYIARLLFTVIDSLNLKLRQIARFSSNMILDEMSSAECHLLFGFFWIVQHKEKPLYHVTSLYSLFT